MGPMDDEGGFAVIAYAVAACLFVTGAIFGAGLVMLAG